MFKYQIHKLNKGEKEARAVLLEDILTSDVFGLMDYFPFDFLLLPFLERVKLKNPKSHFSIPTSEPTYFHFWKSMVWPDNLPNLRRDSIEPDVIIEWPNTLLMVEAKFISLTDPEELLREFLLGISEAGSGRNFFLLLIDKNLSPPTITYEGTSIKISIPEYIERRTKELNLAETISREQISSSLLWINWQSFYALAERLVQSNLLDEIEDVGQASKRILSDLLLILERKGLIPFEVLLLANFNRYEINLNSLHHIGLILSDPTKQLSEFDLDPESLNQVGLMMQGQFYDLSDISIDMKALGKIGLLLNDPVPFLGGLWLEADILRRY